jgi:hypothetical protein
MTMKGSPGCDSSQPESALVAADVSAAEAVRGIVIRTIRGGYKRFALSHDATCAQAQDNEGEKDDFFHRNHPLPLYCETWCQSALRDGPLNGFKIAARQPSIRRRATPRTVSPTSGPTLT